MALSDVFMIKDVQRYEGEELVNMWFYQDTTTAMTAEIVQQAWREDVLPKVLAIQADVVHHVRIEAVNLADPSNFSEYVTDQVGANSDPALPAYAAVNYSLRINSRALRPGSRRFCGICEPFTTNNLITQSSYIALLETLRLQQYARIGLSVAEDLQPIVVKRVKYTPPGAPVGTFAYRLPENDSEFVFGDIVNAQVNLKLSHQVSRGNGR